MKTLIFVLLVFLTSCVSFNNKDTIGWIKKRPKPITVRIAARGNDGISVYTLIDANGEFFNTGTTELNLPSVIKENGVCVDTTDSAFKFSKMNAVGSDWQSANPYDMSCIPKIQSRIDDTIWYEKKNGVVIIKHVK